MAFIADGARVLARRSDPTVRSSLLHDEDAESYGDWLHALTQGKGRDGVAAQAAAIGNGGGSPVAGGKDTHAAVERPGSNSEAGGEDGVAARHRLLPVVWPPEASEAANFPAAL